MTPPARSPRPASSGPPVVLLDVHLPDGDGYGVATELAADDAPPAVILTSTHESADIARGFVPKHELSSEALDAFLAGGSLR